MGTFRRAFRLVVLSVVGACLLAPGAARATTPGAQHMHFELGPLHIQPGQNTIDLAPSDNRPTVPGYITRFAPNIRRADGSVPPVDVIHLHHAVWLINFQPTFAAGEEKTTVDLPSGFGWRYRPTDSWVLNYMIHNLTPQPDTVWITYDIDFIPADSPAAAGITPVRTQWMDVQSGRAYPVFDVARGSGARGRFTYPDQAKSPYGSGPALNQWTVDRDGVLVGAAGHLHPGGLHTDLWLTRDGRKVHLFQSAAHYFEPAGAVSWDVAMTATSPDWRVAVKKGDVLSVSATYDSKRASWYEVMGISPVAIAEGVPGVDPFTTPVDGPGVLTHGHLPENDNHGGANAGLPDPLKLLSGPVLRGRAASRRAVNIKSFVYGMGDLSLSGSRGRPPVIRRGQRLRFYNADWPRTIYHTITACRAPCNRTTGIAYPIADGRRQFDSAELGYGPRGLTAASNRVSWSTPVRLSPGTYTYFCRIHPFMRGAFRVVR
jgi:plastocyanin